VTGGAAQPAILRPGRDRPARRGIGHMDVMGDNSMQDFGDSHTPPAVGDIHAGLYTEAGKGSRSRLDLA